MITWNVAVGGVIIIWVFIYTYSYGKWTWKKNRLGGAAIIALDLFMLIVPIYIAFFNS